MGISEAIEMTEKYFDNAGELLQVFNIDGSLYSTPVILTDRKVGFSTQRKYPPNIRYKPPQTKDNKDDTVALIHVVYTHPSETKKSFDFTKVPLIVRIGPHSLYLAKHFDYNFEDNDCPTERSVEKSKMTPKPIALDYFDEFFFNHEENRFQDNRNNTITGNELCNQVFKEHCNTVHLWRGLRLRLRVGTKSIIIAIVSSIIDLLPWILKKVFGRTIEEEQTTLRAIFEGYKKSDFKRLSTDSLNIFGYKASRSVIITFCFIIFIFCLVEYCFDLRSTYFDRIFSANLLSISHGVLFLWLLDVLIPNALFRIMNRLIRLRKRLMFMP